MADYLNKKKYADNVGLYKLFMTSDMVKSEISEGGNIGCESSVVEIFDPKNLANIKTTGVMQKNDILVLVKTASEVVDSKAYKKILYKARKVIFSSKFLAINSKKFEAIRSYSIGRASNGNVVKLQLVLEGGESLITRLWRIIKSLIVSSEVTMLCTSDSGKLDKIQESLSKIASQNKCKHGVIKKFHVSQKGKVVLDAFFDCKQDLILKVAFTEKACLGLMKNMNTIHLLSKKSRVMKSFWPKMKGYADLGDGCLVTGESKVAGQPIKDIKRSLWSYVDLANLVAALPNFNCKKYDIRELRDNVLEKYGEINRKLDYRLDEFDVKCCLEDVLLDGIQQGPFHGDFSMSNVYLDNSGNYSVIDWDESQNGCLTILNLIYLRVSELLWSGEYYPFWETVKYINNKDYSSAIYYLCNEFGVKPHLYRNLVLLLWVIIHQKKYDGVSCLLQNEKEALILEASLIKYDENDKLG